MIDRHLLPQSLAGVCYVCQATALFKKTDKKRGLPVYYCLKPTPHT